MTPGELKLLPSFRPVGPEHLFGVLDLARRDDGALIASMPAAAWLQSDGAYGGVASLGVLVDNVLGYVLNEHSRGWSVSTELSVDMCEPIHLTPDAVLTCEGRAVHTDEFGAVVTGAVHDAAGRLVAICSLRGRFTDRRPQSDSPPLTPPSPPTADNLPAALTPELDLSSSPATVYVSPRFTNPTGNLHGGMAFCVVEAVAAHSEANLNHTAAVRLQLVRGTPQGARLSLRAHTAHAGRTYAVITVEARDDLDRTVLLATVTREP